MSRRAQLPWAACAALLAAAAARGADAAPREPNAALERWVASVGGRPALNKIHTLELEEANQDASGAAPMAEKALILEPDKVHIDASLPDGRTMELSFDGRTGWREVDDLGFGFLGPSESRWLLLSRDPVEFAKLGKEYTSCVPLPPETRDGAAFDVYLMQVQNSSAERWYFDSSTGLLASIEGGGKPTQFVSSYSDYRKTGDLRLPFEFKLTIGGKTVYSIHRKSISFNVPLTPAYFAAMAWDLKDASRAQAILDKYKKTCASPEAVSKLRSRVMHQTVYSPATGVTSAQVISVVYPRKILIDSDTKGVGRELSGYDGTTGWAYSEILGYHLLKPDEVSGLYTVLSRTGDPMLDAEVPLRRVVGTRLVANRKATALSLSTLREPIGVFYFDEENGHLLRVRALKRVPSGTRTTSTIDFSDFRTVGGQDIPFEIIDTTASLQITTKIQSVEDNVPIDEAIFKPRQEE